MDPIVIIVGIAVAVVVAHARRSHIAARLIEAREIEDLKAAARYHLATMEPNSAPTPGMGRSALTSLRSTPVELPLLPPLPPEAFEYSFG